MFSSPLSLIFEPICAGNFLLGLADPEHPSHTVVTGPAVPDVDRKGPESRVRLPFQGWLVTKSSFPCWVSIPSITWEAVAGALSAALSPGSPTLPRGLRGDSRVADLHAHFRVTSLIIAAHAFTQVLSLLVAVKGAQDVILKGGPFPGGKRKG